MKINLSGEDLGKTKLQSWKGGAWQRIQKRTYPGALGCGEEGPSHRQLNNCEGDLCNVVVLFSIRTKSPEATVFGWAQLGTKMRIQDEPVGSTAAIRCQIRLSSSIAEVAVAVASAWVEKNSRTRVVAAEYCPSPVAIVRNSWVTGCPALSR